jgi:thiol-disulfide isomerase/thioredoxin
MRATCERLLGQAQLGLGRLEAAIVSLSNAAAAAADSEVVLFQLGRAFEKKGQADDAINAYIRSLGVFPRGDTTAAAPLRALYARHHGSLSGLDARIDVARRASTQRVALEARRYDAPAPDWKLPDLSGGTLESASFKGKVVVLDFWGSWCGPCRAELPYFQAMYDRYKDRGVAFVGINWEREPTAEKRIAAARSFIASKGFSFPVALDLDHKTVEAYAVESFPTLLVIDKVGRMRYRNAGFSPDIEPILTAQIESLIE